MKLEITNEERDELLRLIESAFQETRVEARHSQDRDYRERVHREEDILRGLLDKFNQPVSSPLI